MPSLLILLLQFLSGIYLFTQGYLLTRIVLPNVGQKCVDYHPPSRYNKTLMVLVDALRFDFINYDPALKNAPHFRNKVPIIHEMLMNKPNNSLLFKGLADAPTTTLQRLIAIMTGTVFIFLLIVAAYTGRCWLCWF
jgi:phosphatidylinositol glycan class O